MCAQEVEWTYWTKDVEDGAGGQKEKGKTSDEFWTHKCFYCVFKGFSRKVNAIYFVIISGMHRHKNRKTDPTAFVTPTPRWCINKRAFPPSESNALIIIRGSEGGGPELLSHIFSIKWIIYMKSDYISHIHLRNKLPHVILVTECLRTVTFHQNQ